MGIRGLPITDEKNLKIVNDTFNKGEFLFIENELVYRAGAMDFYIVRDQSEFRQVLTLAENEKPCNLTVYEWIGDIEYRVANDQTLDYALKLLKNREEDKQEIVTAEKVIGKPLIIKFWAAVDSKEMKEWFEEHKDVEIMIASDAPNKNPLTEGYVF